MLLAETVTLGTSDLDRAAQLRGDHTALQAALDQGAPVIPFWRGKPLVQMADANGDMPLAGLPQTHPIFADTKTTPLFLGTAGGQFFFAQDIPDWADHTAPDTSGDPSQQTTHPATPEYSFQDLRTIMTALPRRDGELAATARAVLGWHQSHGFCSNCGGASHITDAGWRRHCPACLTDHFPRTDPVVIMLITDGDYVLLGRSPGWPDKIYSLLAGFVEPGETIESAVRRETFEESGIRVGHVRYLASQPWPYPSSLMLGCHGQATSRDITIDPAEIADARWVSKSDLLSIHSGQSDAIRPARPGSIAHFLVTHWLADKLG
jgi:NAD+ diphosphatase